MGSINERSGEGNAGESWTAWILIRAKLRGCKMIDFYFGITPVYKFGLDVWIEYKVIIRYIVLNILESVQKAQEKSETSQHSSFLDYGMFFCFFCLP